MKSFAKFGFIALTSIIFACGGTSASDLCNRQSPCSADTPSSPQAIQQCKATADANASAPCFGDALALAKCQADNIVCGGDNKRDSKLSATKATNNCKDQTANGLSCCTKNPNSTLCKS